MLLANLPPPDEIRRVAAEVLQDPEYHTESLSENLGPVQSLWMQALEWILTWFEWLVSSLGFLPAVLRVPFAIVLVALLVFLIVRMIMGISRVARLPKSEQTLRPRQRRVLSVDELEALAREAHERGDVIEAIRLLLRSAVLRLELAEKRPNRPGTTNRELLRRYRAPEIQTPLKTMVDTIDVKWFGGRPSEADDYSRSRDAYQRLCSVISAQTTAAASAEEKS